MLPIPSVERSCANFIKFVGSILDHRPSNGHLRTIEALGKYSLPSSNDESLAAVILGKIPLLGLRKQITELPVEFCELLISMWAMCVEGKYVGIMLHSSISVC